jgi:hypothetical protein
MKKVILLLIILTAISCVSNKAVTNLGALSKMQREKYLIDQSKETILKYGPDYYRNHKTPLIEEKVITASDTVNAMEGLGIRLGRCSYQVTFMYDSSKEILDRDYAAIVSIWEDTGKPYCVFFGNGYGRIIYENMGSDDLGPVPYEQLDISPIYDFWSGKEIDIKTTDPVNKKELIMCGFERQPDGNWIKVKPDVPPKY